MFIGFDEHGNSYGLSSSSALQALHFSSKTGTSASPQSPTLRKGPSAIRQWIPVDPTTYCFKGSTL